MAMGQKPNRSPSEHPNPTTKIPTKMGGAPKTPKWYPMGVDLRPYLQIPEVPQTPFAGMPVPEPAKIRCDSGCSHVSSQCLSREGFAV